MKIMPVTALTAILAGASPVLAVDDNEVAALRQQVAELQARLDIVESDQNDAWLTERRAEDISALVYDVLADADSRVSLLQGGGTAGYDGGAIITDASGNYKLKINGQIQARYVYNNRDGGMPSSIDENIAGFEMRRTKLTFAGHVVDPAWTYKVQAAFARDGGAFILEDSYVQYDYGNGWKARAGQYKLPLLREELVSSKRQLAIERTLVHGVFSTGRSQGVMATYKDEANHIQLSFNDGAGNANTPWQSDGMEYAVTGRYERLISGNWKQFRDFTSWEGDDTGWLFGVAGHFQEGEFGTPGLETETTILTADLSGEFGGANLFASYVYRSMDDDAALDVEQHGVVVQGGVHINDGTELFARYEWADLDLIALGMGSGAADDVSVITVGFNRYFDKHNLKWTTDFGFAIDPIESPASSSSRGYRTDAVDQDGQFVVRTQLQLLF